LNVVPVFEIFNLAKSDHLPTPKKKQFDYKGDQHRQVSMYTYLILTI